MEHPALHSHKTGTKSCVVLHPPAKINLSLWVGSKRPDQFHEIHTVMAAISLCDDMKIESTDTTGIQLTCTGLDCPETRENLVYNAAELIAADNDISPAIHIHLHKNIPAGGGLGGASSDAAFCLLGLNKLWKLNLPVHQLEALAAELGSDVAFFLHTPVAVCTGRGEIVQPIPQRCDLHILLIIPNIHVSTASVYKHYQPDETLLADQMKTILCHLGNGDLNNLTRSNINSLTPVTMNLHQNLSNIKEKIEDLGISPVFMSGSGSSLFAVHESQQTIIEWSELLKTQDFVQCEIVSFLDRSESFLEVHHANF